MNITGYQGNFQPSVPVSIAASAQESSVISLKGFALVGIALPPVFTGTALSFLVGDSEDGFQANGQVEFAQTIDSFDTLVINGVTITFVLADPDSSNNEVLIGANQTETMANLYAFLQSGEGDAALQDLTYSSNGVFLVVTAVVHGTAGNSYTFTGANAGSVMIFTPSGGTLGGGGFRPLYTAANSLLSMTVAQGRAYLVDKDNFEGFGYLKIKSGSAEAGARSLVASLKGF